MSRKITASSALKLFLALIFFALAYFALRFVYLGYLTSNCDRYFDGCNICGGNFCSLASCPGQFVKWPRCLDGKESEI